MPGQDWQGIPGQDWQGMPGQDWQGMPGQDWLSGSCLYPGPTLLYHGWQDSSVVRSTGLVTVRTGARIQAMAGFHHAYELLSFILAPIAPTSLRLRRYVK